MPRRTLRTRIRRGETIVGTFLIAFPGAAAARVAAGAGADFVLIDGEHTGFGWDAMTPVLSAARAAGSVPFVRVPSAARDNLALALDIGATGLMIPMIASAEEAAAVASWARYPPLGVRGAMFGLAAHDFGEVDPAAAVKKSNDETIVMVQVETAAALAEIDDIAAVPGIDVIWIGHYDLSMSMGIPTQFDSPIFVEAIERIVAASSRHGVAVGFLASGPEHARELVDRGIRVLAFGSDIALYRRALRDGLEEVRAAVE